MIVLRRCYSNSAEGWANNVQVVFQIAPTPTHAHTDASCHEKETLKYNCCCAITANIENAQKVRDGVIPTHRRSRQQTAQQKKKLHIAEIDTALLEAVPTAVVGSLDGFEKY